MTETTNAAPAAEFITPPTGDPDTDARMASQAKALESKPDRAPAKATESATTTEGGKPAPKDDPDHALREAGLLNDDDEADDASDEFDDAETDADGADDEGDDTEDAKEEDFEEIEVQGRKHKLPKELKPLLMMQQDYTRKTQEVAEQRKVIETTAAALQTRQAALDQQAQFATRVVGELAELAALDKQLAAYANIDWQRFDQEDPIEAGRVWRQHELLKQSRQNLVGRIQEAEAKFQHEKAEAEKASKQAASEQFLQRQAAAAKAFRERNPGISDKTIEGVIKFAQERAGFTLAELNNVADPRPLQLLYEAYIGHQLIARQKQAGKAKAPAPVEVKPLAPAPRGRPAPASRGLSDKLSAEEWVRRRNAQLRARG